MLSNPLIATTLIFALIAFGEWLSLVTRARIPMLLTAMVGFLLLSWTGIFPEDISGKIPASCPWRNSSWSGNFTYGNNDSFFIVKKPI